MDYLEAESQVYPKEGWLTVEGFNHSWTSFFVCLSCNSKTLSYFNDESKSILQGEYLIDESTTFEVKDSIGLRQNILVVNAMQHGEVHSLLMSAVDIFERDEWAAAFTQLLDGVKISIPDVFPDIFHVSVPLKIVYGGNSAKVGAGNGLRRLQPTVTVESGNKIMPSILASAPTVLFEPRKSYEYYSLILIDPDVPSRTDPRHREFAHWVIVNIPGNDISSGKTVLPYVGPTPLFNTGIHRRPQPTIRSVSSI